MPPMRTAWALAAMVAPILATGACEGDGAGTKVIEDPGSGELEVRSETSTLSYGSVVRVDASIPAQISIVNTGTDILRVTEIRMSSDPPVAFTLEALPHPLNGGILELPPGTTEVFSVAYHPEDAGDGIPPSATVQIVTRPTVSRSIGLVFYLVPESSELMVSPSTLDFGMVPLGESGSSTANLINTGSASIIVDRIVFAGHPGFSVRLGGETYRVTAESASIGVPLREELVVLGGILAPVDAIFTASGSGAAQASLMFLRLGADRGPELKLLANAAAPCITTVPSKVSFGGSLVGQISEQELEIQSCGERDLVISAIDVASDSPGAFDIRAAQVGIFPVTVPAGSSVFLPVTYLPSAVGEIGPEGPSLEQGEIRITSNAYLNEVLVPVDGFGTDRICPTARIEAAEGNEVLPQTVLHLSGVGSSSPRGSIASFEWSVSQPAGSTSTLSPSPYVSQPTFEANMVGEYTFSLRVIDANGLESCSPAEYVVVVVNDDAIHIELTWRTPGDINETDTGGDQIYFSVGSDLDLILEPSATDPRTRDDTDGGGPENVNVADPTDGRYTVRVHYYSDWGYGSAFATVRIFIRGVLRDQWSGVELVNDDMWDTHYVDWPSGTVTRIGSSPQIIHDYREQQP